MISYTHPHRRPFLDVAEAEATADLDVLTDTLSRAVRDADRLGLTDVKGHLEAALDGAEALGEGGDEA